MTINTNSAQLKFTQKPGALVPADPAQTDPNVVTLSNGKQYRIKVEILINGTWTKVDNSKFSKAYLTTLAERCQGIYQTTTHETNEANTLTVYFKHKNLPESWKSLLVGRFITKYKDPAADLSFRKIEYKTDGSTELKSFDIETHEFDAETDAAHVDRIARSFLLLPETTTLFGNPEHFLAPPEKIKRKKQAESTAKQLPALEAKPPTKPTELQAIERVLNVTKNNGEGNKCAAISVAMILLQRYGDLQTVKAAILSMNEGLALPVERGRDAQDILTNLLIDLAANVIESRSEFSNADPADSSNPYYANVVASLRAAGRPQPAPNANRKMVVKEYADLIRSNGEMLDVSFFDALNLLGISSITLKPSPNGFVLGSIYTQNLFKADIDHIEGSVLGQICFVVHDQLHYRAAMLPSNLTAEQTALLRAIFKNDLNKTLGQITALAADPKAADDKYDEMFNLISSIVTQYSTDAKPIITKMLIEDKRFFDPKLSTENNEAFIEAATDAFLRPTMNEHLKRLDELVKVIVPSASDVDVKKNPAYADINSIITDLIRNYPIETKPLIIEMLNANRRIFNPNLNTLPNDDLIQEAVRAFLRAPKTDVESVD